MSDFALRPYQIKMINELFAALREGHKPVAQIATGGGKTFCIAKIFELGLRRGKRMAFCMPFLSLINQSYSAFVDAGIDRRDIGVLQADHPLTDWTAPILICSVDTLVRRKKLPEVDIVIYDEIHRDSALIGRWIKEAPNTMFAGVSATPWTAHLHKTFTKLIVAATTRELIDQGYLAPFRVYAPASPDLSGVRITAGDYNETDLSAAMNKPNLVADVVKTWLHKGRGRPTFVFAVDCAHARSLAEQFEAAGVPTGYVDAYTPVEEREAMIAQLRDGYLEVICNVGTMTTGVDAPFVSCIVLARPTRSEALYCLDSETQILTSHGWKGIGEVKIGDCAAALTDLDSRAGAWSRVEGVIERDMDESESWIEYSAPRANFRVTDKHRMIFRGANESRTSFRISEAVYLQKCKGGAYVPTAVQIDQSGVPLTDDELYFIGIMMTDGTWTPTMGAISQSERHPEIIERIESCLRGCGIGYAKRRVSPPPADAQIQEKFPRWVFHFSSGKPKSLKIGKKPLGLSYDVKNQWEKVGGKTGFRHLMPFLDKDFSPALMALSRSQFLTLLRGMHDGDGFKLRNVEWEPKTWTLCTSRQICADRLQALAAINGMTCNIRAEHGTRKNPIWIVSITPKDWLHIGGYASNGKNGGVARNKRPQIEISSATNERVWCVQTEAGTIVTRRRGKVMVMGNCQIVGRGLRLHPDKTDGCLILDHSDTALTLGLPDEIHYDDFPRGKDKLLGKREKEEKLPKKCPACDYLKPAGVHECPACGYKPERKSKLICADGELVELGAAGQRAGKQQTAKQFDMATKQEWWSGILWIANERGKTKGWASHTYRNKFGVWPNQLNDVMAYPTDAVRSYIRSRNIAYAKGMARRQA
jgi:superfamily II DNA or RNA helicase